MAFFSSFKERTLSRVAQGGKIFHKTCSPRDIDIGCCRGCVLAGYKIKPVHVGITQRVKWRGWLTVFLQHILRYQVCELLFIHAGHIQQVHRGIGIDMIGHMGRPFHSCRC